MQLRGSGGEPPHREQIGRVIDRRGYLVRRARDRVVDGPFEVLQRMTPAVALIQQGGLNDNEGRASLGPDVLDRAGGANRRGTRGRLGQEPAHLPFRMHAVLWPAKSLQE